MRDLTECWLSKVSFREQHSLQVLRSVQGVDEIRFLFFKLRKETEQCQSLRTSARDFERDAFLLKILDATERPGTIRTCQRRFHEKSIDKSMRRLVAGLALFFWGKLPFKDWLHLLWALCRGWGHDRLGPTDIVSKTWTRRFIRLRPWLLACRVGLCNILKATNRSQPRSFKWVLLCQESFKERISLSVLESGAGRSIS